MRGTTVCNHCADLFRTALRDLVTAWPDLETGVARDRSSSAGTGAVHSSRIAEVGDYWRPHVTRAITDIREWLSFLDRALQTNRTRGPLGVSLARIPPQQALAALAYAAKPILIDHPALAEALVGEALRLRGRAHRALDTNYVRRVPLHVTCMSDVDVDDPDAVDGVRHERCGGTLAAVFQPLDLGGSSAILCSRFPAEHTVLPDQWGALADELQALR